MTITLVKTSVVPHKRGTTDASTYERHQEGSHVFYRAWRESKKKPGDMKDWYDLPVDEELCIVKSCECYNYVHVQQPVGDTCKHMRALERRLIEEKQRRTITTTFQPTHRLQIGTDKSRTYWRVQVVGSWVGHGGVRYYNALTSPKNKSGYHFVGGIPENRLKPLQWGKNS